MIKSGPLVIDEELGASTVAAFDTGGVEAAVAHLRDAGEGKIGSIRVLVKACGFSLRDAKRVVHLSPSWLDRREADDAFHDQLAAVAELLNAEEGEQQNEFMKAS